MLLANALVNPYVCAIATLLTFLATNCLPLYGLCVRESSGGSLREKSAKRDHRTARATLMTDITVAAAATAATVAVKRLRLN